MKSRWPMVIRVQISHELSGFISKIPVEEDFKLVTALGFVALGAYPEA
jgi:hypothetical protein